MAEKLYWVDGVRINDSWYIKNGENYYAYYLQYPENAPEAGKWNEQSIGLSVSADLTEWAYKGTVLEPDKNSWNDKGIATGSIVEKDGKFYLLYTGNSWNNEGGFGLAVSSDLIHFERYGTEPVITRKKPYRFPYMGDFVECRLLADPYIYPVPVNGWFYVFINCYAVAREIGKRGCIAVMRSRDLVHYEEYGISMLSEVYDRLETPQIWEQNGVWMMYFGGVKAKITQDGTQDYFSENLIYVSDHFSHGYHEVNGSVIVLPDQQYFYIGKTVIDKNNVPVFLVNEPPVSCRGPYYIEYKNEIMNVSM